MQQVIKKPWGQETILTEGSLPYAVKILFVKAGQRLSLQSHDQKTETLTLISGQANISLGPNQESIKESPMKNQTGYTILPNTVHRLEAISDCQIFEASTPEKGTTKRLEDDYQRTDETEKVRSSDNRGWQ
jgi:mannose-6-phosphate isomerase-like protein (cupin superfamily)